jgi:hypothetical protein
MMIFVGYFLSGVLIGCAIEKLGSLFWKRAQERKLPLGAGSPVPEVPRLAESERGPTPSMLLVENNRLVDDLIETRAELVRATDLLHSMGHTLEEPETPEAEQRRLQIASASRSSLAAQLAAIDPDVPASRGPDVVIDSVKVSGLIARELSSAHGLGCLGDIDAFPPSSDTTECDRLTRLNP